VKIYHHVNFNKDMMDKSILTNVSWLCMIAWFNSLSCKQIILAKCKLKTCGCRYPLHCSHGLDSSGLESVWERCSTRVLKKFEIFFLLKFNMVCTFWIVLMCWCQKWFLKNKKKSLACILARKVIWKAPATTLPNTLASLETRQYVF